MAHVLSTHKHTKDIVTAATMEVFSTMFEMKVTEEMLLFETANTVNNGGLLAVVGMSGAVSGNGYLYLSEALACHITSRFLMAEYTQVNDEVLDAISELCNMIVGNIKSTLEEQYGPMGLSIPTVIYSKDYRARSSNLGETIKSTFLYEGDSWSENFSVVLCLTKEKTGISGGRGWPD